MKPENALHQLIHSLSPAEKRYFKLYAKTQGREGYKKQYEKLFDALNAWENEYDDEAFKKKHSNKTFLRNFSFNKHHLYELILKASIQPLRDSNPIINFMAQVQESEFLAGKKLRKQYLEKLNDIYTEVKEKGSLPLELLLHIRRFNIIRPQDDAEIEFAYSKTETLIQQIHDFSRIQYISRKMGYYADRLYISNSPNDRKLMDDLYAEAKKLLKKEDELTIDMWIGLVYATQTYMGETNHKEAIPFCLSAIKQIETTRALKYNQVPYSAILNNTLKIICMHYPHTHYTLFYELLEKLKQIKYGSVNIYAEVFGIVNACSAELHILSIHKNFDKCNIVINNFFKQYDRIAKFIMPDELLRLFMNFAQIAIYNGDYDKAQEHAKEGLKSFGKHKNAPLEFNYRVVVFMTLALTDEYDKLDNALLALQRFGKRNEVKDELFSTIIEMCKTIIKTVSLNSPEVKAINRKLQTVPHYQTQIKTMINELVENPKPKRKS